VEYLIPPLSSPVRAFAFQAKIFKQRILILSSLVKQGVAALVGEENKAIFCIFTIRLTNSKRGS
jgi:hypothetical protein